MQNKDFQPLCTGKSHFIRSISYINKESKNVIVEKGKNNCDEIEEHCAKGEGDKWFYDIYYSDNTIIRVFNPIEVLFSAYSN